MQWRRLTRVLWVGRRDGRHVGMIEQGREYVATDDEGVVRGRFRDLRSAESAFDDAAEDASPAKPRRVRRWPFIAGGTAAAVILAGITTAAVLLQ